jgi:hypothetical protein
MAVMIFMDFSSFPSSGDASVPVFADLPGPIQPMMKVSSICTETGRTKTTACVFSRQIFSRRRFRPAPNGRRQA